MYAKVFTQIFDSSIAEDYLVRLVFEDLLKLADPNGVVDMTHESIARRTNVPLDIVLRGIKALESPDPKSRNPQDGGIRIKRLDKHRDWGWMIVNQPIYRAINNEEQRREKTRERVRKHRERKRLAKSGNNEVLHGVTAALRSVTSASASASASLTEDQCVYCGITELQAGIPHQEEPFIPVCVGGLSEPENMLVACSKCNGAKQGRRFETVEDCRTWLHWRFWMSARRKYSTHRQFAFGGNPPSSETVARGLWLHTNTVAQPDNSRVLGTSASFRSQEADLPSLKEVLLYADKIGLAPWKAEDWFNEMEGCGWLDYQHRPVKGWRPVLVRVKLKWEADGRPKGPPTNPNHKPVKRMETDSERIKRELAKL